MPLKNKLRAMKLDEISLVDSPANKEARAVLFKRDMSKGEGDGDSTDSKDTYDCAECDESFDSQSALDQHMESEHPDVAKADGGDSSDSFECPVDGETFDSQEELDQHMNDEHPDFQKADGGVNCPHCGAAAKDKFTLNTHISEKHPDKAPNSSPTKKSDPLSRLMMAVAKRIGISNDELSKYDIGEYLEGEADDEDDGDDADPDDFAQALREQRTYQVYDALWERVTALSSALDEQLESGADTSMLLSSVDQFADSLKTAIPAVLDDVSKAGKKISSDRMSRLKEAHDKLKEAHGQFGAIISEVDNSSGVADGGEKDKEKKPLGKGGDMPTIEELQAELAKKDQEIEELKKSADPEGGKSEEEDIFKGLPSAAAEKLRSEIAKNEANEQKISKMEEEREIAEFEEKVSKSYAHVAGTPRELAVALRTITKSDPDAAAVIEARLAASEEAVRVGKVFGEFGKAGQEQIGSTAWDAIVAKGDEIRKSETSLSPEQARTKAIDMHPELKVQYDAEQRVA